MFEPIAYHCECGRRWNNPRAFHSGLGQMQWRSVVNVSEPRQCHDCRTGLTNVLAQYRDRDLMLRNAYESQGMSWSSFHGEIKRRTKTCGSCNRAFAVSLTDSRWCDSCSVVGSESVEKIHRVKRAFRMKRRHKWKRERVRAVMDLVSV